MDKHVTNLTRILSDAADRVLADPSYISQARTLGYLAGRVVYAAGQHARFSDRTPYFSLQKLGGGRLRAVASDMPRDPSTSVMPKSTPPDDYEGSVPE